MTIGFIPELTRSEMSEVGLMLTWKVQQSQPYEIPALFENDPTPKYGEKVPAKADEIRDEMLDERVEMRLCSDPTESATEIYRCLGYKSKPFRRYAIKPSAQPN